jgi:hypothetical protein
MGARTKGTAYKQERRRAARRTKILTWLAVAGVIGVIGYGVSQMSGVPFSDRDMTAVDFSTLNRSEKNVALKAANQARCTCGCGMSLAQCVATDSTCPIREGNIVKINKMVEDAREPRPSS